MTDLLLEHGIDSPEKLQELFEPHYFAVVPMEVLERRDLNANAKLLYGEITGLTRKNGYCMATDKYIADRIGLRKDSIRNLMQKLELKNLIRRETTKTAKGTYRRIYLTWRTPPAASDNATRSAGDSRPVASADATGASVGRYPAAPDNATKREIDKEKSEKEILLLSGFEKFWQTYPNKKAKKKALEKWMRMEPSPELAEKIIAGVEAAKKTHQWKKDNGDFIPHPTTYLNQERWNDELKVDSPKTGGGKFESVKSTKV